MVPGPGPAPVTGPVASSGRVRAIVERVWQETPRLLGARLAVPDGIATLHRVPGQFIVVHPPGGKVHLVIASHPSDRGGFELLLGESAQRTLGLGAGQEVEIDPPAGGGYAIDQARGADVLLFAVGSAIASLRPVVAAIRSDRSAYGRVTFFMGAHSAEDFPYGAEHGAWQRDRIDLFRAISRPWVQDLFEREAPDIGNSVAFISGGKQMMADVSSALERAGLPRERIRRNF